MKRFNKLAVEMKNSGVLSGKDAALCILVVNAIYDNLQRFIQLALLSNSSYALHAPDRLTERVIDQQQNLLESSRSDQLAVLRTLLFQLGVSVESVNAIIAELLLDLSEIKIGVSA